MTNNEIEWKSDDIDYQMVILRVPFGKRHRCGYVSVPKNHPFFGKSYRHEIPFDVQNAKVNPTDPIGTFCAAFKAAEDDSKMEISYAANVHGGITFSDGKCGYPLPDSKDDWWFGFAAAHCDDNDEGGKSLAYMIDECKKLQTFLKEHDTQESKAA